MQSPSDAHVPGAPTATDPDAPKVREDGSAYYGNPEGREATDADLAALYAHVMSLPYDDADRERRARRAETWFAAGSDESPEETW